MRRCTGAWTMVAIGVLVLAGCQDGGLRVGQMTLVQPKTPLKATHVIVARSAQQPALTTAVWGQATQGQVNPNSDVLQINLGSGHATLTPQGGQQYPVQLSPDRLAEVRQTVSNRSWNFGSLKPQKQAQSITWYELAVYDGDRLLEREVAWAVPAAKDLPPSAQTFVRAFEAADRNVNPLSKNVNLLE